MRDVILRSGVFVFGRVSLGLVSVAFRLKMWGVVWSGGGVGCFLGSSGGGFGRFCWDVGTRPVLRVPGLSGSACGECWFDGASAGAYTRLREETRR
jgi:hypothetical protein